jgi:fluoride ion exporter CrcB/FEX
MGRRSGLTAPSGCRHDEADIEYAPLTGHERIVRDPAGPAPLRRANSVRRTSTIDVGWPDGFGQPMLMIGRARDVLTGPDGGAPKPLAEDSFRILATSRREILEIEVEPDRPSVDTLIGARGGGHLRALLAEVMPEERASGSPLYLILDDYSGASLVAGWIWSQWTDNWAKRVADNGARSTAGRNGVMTDICAGFATGSTALAEDGSSVHPQNCAEVISLRNPNDPEGWHEFVDHAPVSFRRARRIDVWREGEDVRIEIGFQDSGINPKGGRTAVHEYLVHAVARGSDLALAEVTVEPRVLPYRECPNAAPNATRMMGQKLSDFRQSVLTTLPHTLGCTHLNDVLRSMAEVPQLMVRLPS